MKQKRKIKQTLGQILPRPAKTFLGKAHNRILENRANREKKLTLSGIEVGRNAPDHIILVVVDALRADVITEEIAPFLYSCNRQTAITASPWTYPAVSSLLSGLYPHNHRAIRRSDNPDQASKKELQIPPQMDSNIPTLPDIFRNADYLTYGAFAFDMPFLALSGRFDQHNLYLDNPANDVLFNHLNWLRRRNQRTFSYLHLGDLHEPTKPPESYIEKHDVDMSIDGITNWRFEDRVDMDEEVSKFVENKKALYKATTEYVDDVLMRYGKRLNQIPGEKMVIITADHGEGLWDNAKLDKKHFVDSRPAYSVGHGGTPYESIVQVPLISFGDFFETKPDRQISLIDLYPSILNKSGINQSCGCDGVPLSDEQGSTRKILVEGARYGYEKKAIYLNDLKLIVSRGDNVSIGFKLPEEKKTDIPEEIEESMKEALPTWVGNENGQKTGKRTVSNSVANRLENLGYK